MMATIGEDIEQILRERLDELEAIEAPSLPDFWLISTPRWLR
jgi:hypothetical protein